MVAYKYAELDQGHPRPPPEMYLGALFAIFPKNGWFQNVIHN